MTDAPAPGDAAAPAAAPSLADLTRVFGRIGVLSFGGPAAQISLMHAELVDRRAWFEPQIRQLVAFCASPRLAARAASCGGYDVTGFGDVLWNA
jgi:hypothetical protein